MKLGCGGTAACVACSRTLHLAQSLSLVAAVNSNMYVCRGGGLAAGGATLREHAREMSLRNIKCKRAEKPR